MATSRPEPHLPFRFLRWFSLASLGLIVALAASNALLISTFLSKHLLEREAQVTHDFVQNILLADDSLGYLADPTNPELAARFQGSVVHFTTMRGVLRTNVYMPDGTVLWSSDQSLVGRRFSDNHELEEALRGRLVVESGRITDEVRRKPEHVGLPQDSQFFVETYIPVVRTQGSGAIGVVEMYKAPIGLTEVIVSGQRQVWLAAALGALVLYLTLFWIVRRADHTIRRQHTRLVEAEALAAAGELGSSMAHNIRNPLSSIRSSAELCLEHPNERNEEQARDIIRAADRIEAWLRELLRFTRSEISPPAPVDIQAVIAKVFSEQTQELARRGVSGDVTSTVPGARVNADGAVLAQVLHSIVANAVEASGAGGRVTATIAPAVHGMVAVRVADTGDGIPPEHLESVFRPFFTTKREGLGLGLALARRTVERMGGRIGISSAPGAGTTVTLELPQA